MNYIYYVPFFSGSQMIHVGFIFFLKIFLVYYFSKGKAIWKSNQIEWGISVYY